MARISFFSRSRCAGMHTHAANRRTVAVLVAGIALGLVLGALSWRSAAVQASSGTPPGPVPAPAVLGPTPTGLIAVSDYDPSLSSTSVFNLTPAVYTNPSISGVALRVNWQDLEPSADTFNWETITDPVFAQATANNKFVALILVPGFETPAWALQGVQTDTFTPQYGPLANQQPGVAFPLPMPWDQAYLSQWFAFLQQVADKYGSNPAFRMIAAAGPTSVSEETSLPNKKLDAALPSGVSDTAEWVKDGYTPAKYEGAWQTVFQNYAQIFPNQYISLSLAEGIGVGSGTCDATCQIQATPQSIINDGLKPQYKDRFVLQENALRAPGYGEWAYDLVNTNSGNVVTGFEVGAVNQEGNPAPVQALSVTLQNGLAAQVDFLEVYTFDVLNPAMQDVLQSTASQLPYAPTSPIPLRPPCHGSTCS